MFERKAINQFDMYPLSRLIDTPLLHFIFNMLFPLPNICEIGAFKIFLIFFIVANCVPDGIKYDYSIK